MGCGVEAAAGSGTLICPHSCRNLFPASSEGKCFQGGQATGSHVGTGVSPGPKRNGNEKNLLQSKSFFSLSGYRARELCLGPAWSRANPMRGPALSRRLPKPGLSSPQPRKPGGTHTGTLSSRCLTCQALRSYPISCGRPAAAAMFSASRCQSVWRWPMGGRAGGQVIAGQLAPHWCALPSLPLGLCARSE